MEAVNNYNAAAAVNAFVAELTYRRARIAAIEDTVQGLMPSTFPSRWQSWAKMYLALGRGWYGKALGVLGSEHPYPQSTNPMNTHIEPRAYQSDGQVPDLSECVDDAAIFITEVKWARRQIELVLERQWPYDYKGLAADTDLNEFARRLALAATNLENAKMMLGEELGAIRDYGARAIKEKVEAAGLVDPDPA